MKCPTCGTENDANNRFCDQCGARLETSGAAPQAQAVSAAQPTAAAVACPSCGAVVLPGEAFCDECGTSLSGLAPTADATSYDAPTVYAPPIPSSAPVANEASSGSLCPACGHQNLPGDRFCDNCGASLAAATSVEPEVPTAAVAPAEEPAVAPTLDEEPAAPPAPVEEPAAPPAPVEEPPAPVVPAEEPPAPVVPVEEPPAPAEEPAAAVAPALDDSAYQAEKKGLEEVIAQQQQIISQFEQMQSMFGAATPPAVTQGLADARDALAQAEAKLAALQPPAPAVDPAEVQRLEEVIAQQQQIISQFEQMQSMFGAATPPAVTQGLAEARDALAQAQADLAALTGGAAVAPAAPAAPVAPAAPAEEAPAAPVAPTAPAEEAPAAPVPLEAVAPAAPVAPVAPAPAPRLVIDEGGQEILLPTGKTEFVIGREDPISGIFPEVDLTPFGGESGGVSRQHARINHSNGDWTLTDLNSTNYSRVDGTKLDPNSPVPIKDGSRLQFGRVAATFRI